MAISSSSSDGVAGNSSETGGDRRVCLVDGAIVQGTPRGGLQNDTLVVRSMADNYFINVREMIRRVPESILLRQIC
jgi:hypothetical protein